MKVLIHDGLGVWVALRRLNRGKFVWTAQGSQLGVWLDRGQFQGLILGLDWHRVGRALASSRSFESSQSVNLVS